MGKLLLYFSGAFLFLAAAVGLYLGATAVNLLGAFWLVVTAAVAVALVRKVWPPLKRAMRQWRDYPALEAKVATLKARNNKLKIARDEAREAIPQARLEGIAEGTAQALGAVLSANAVPPELIGITEFHGAVSLVAAAGETELQLGARFRVVVSTTGEARGVVQVAAFDTDRNLYYLSCVEVITPAFWEALRDKVDIDSSPPLGVQLESFKLNIMLEQPTTASPEAYMASIAPEESL